MRKMTNHKKEQFKHKVLLVLSIVFAISLGVYFYFRNSYAWVPEVIPEFIGFAWLGIIIVYAIKKNTKMQDFLLLFGSILLIALISFAIGWQRDIRFLADVMPEFVGATGLGILLSIIFKKKMML